MYSSGPVPPAPGSGITPGPGMPPGPGGYLGSQSGPDAPGYPPQPGGYPSQTGGYPTHQGGYPSMPGGYMPTAGLQTSPYPPQQQARRLDPDQMPSPVSMVF